MSDLQTTLVTFDTLDRHGALFTGFLRARHRVFIERRGWDLPNVRGLEFDQYDTPESAYLVLHQDGEVLAGQRLTPTNARCMTYSYMIRDAQRGILDSLPSNLLYEAAPVDPAIWEISRGFMNEDLEPRLRKKLRIALGFSLVDAAKSLGIERYLSILPKKWPVLTARLPFQIEAAGPVFHEDSAPSQAVIFNHKPEFLPLIMAGRKKADSEHRAAG